jgi:N-acetylneuraminic acid mutarotase
MFLSCREMNNLLKRLFLPLICALATFGCQKEPDTTIETNQLIITSFSPDSGKEGVEVMIRGKGFSEQPANNIVMIGDDSLQVVSASDTLLVVKVLAGTNSGKITVSVNNETVTSINEFLVLTDSLKILSFSPESGKEDTEITIKGEGFAALPTENKVTINGTDAEIISSSDSVLIVKVLPATTTGKISIKTNGQTVVSSNDFTVDTVIDEPWVQKADCPEQWYNGMDISIVNGFALDNMGYFYNAGKLWQYNPSANAWSAKADLPSGSENTFTFCFTAGGKAYIGLGGGGDISRENDREVWEYSPGTNQWARKKDFPGAPRVLPFSFSIDNMGYVGGGDTANSSLDNFNDFWQYDPGSDLWTRKADFPGTLVTGVSGFAIDNNGYVLEAGSGNSAALLGGNNNSLLWQYNPASNQWTQKATLAITNREIFSATCFALNGKAYAAIATDDMDRETDKKDFWQYDPALNQWINKPDVGGGYRIFASSFVIGNKAYVGLGTGNTVDNVFTDLWQYTP